MKKIKLYCLPYAGGSSGIYAGWNKRLNDSIEIHPIEFAGRGKRYSSSLYKSFGQAVDDIYKLIEKDIASSSAYSIFGHSFGGLIAYELTHKIIQEGKPQPEHIFFSGVKAPNAERSKDIIHELPDDMFMQKIIALGGTPREVIENKELQDIVLPILKADFTVDETYEYIEKEGKIGCDITVLYGKYENIKNDEIVEWRNHTTGKCDIHTFEGNHFFINTHTDDVIGIINKVLSKELISGK